MIHVARVPEPKDFDAQARQPGLKWLETHPHANRPRDFWSPFKSHLARGFNDLCGYSAMYEPVGTVDHYVSWKSERALAFEWDNLRYASGWINSSKQTADGQVLDPYEVQDGWFEIILPSLQLRLTDKVPLNHRERAEATLIRLHLRDDERIMRQRRAWLACYQEGEITLDGLRRFAPLIARAIESQHSPPTEQEL